MLTCRVAGAQALILRYLPASNIGEKALATPIFKDEHELFRKTVRAFIDREIAPNYERWTRTGR